MPILIFFAGMLTFTVQNTSYTTWRKKQTVWTAASSVQACARRF